MPQYHFHVATGARLDEPTGTELPDDNAAHLEAVRFAGEMLKDMPEQLWGDGQWRVEVCDARNVLLFTVIVLAIDAPMRKP